MLPNLLGATGVETVMEEAGAADQGIQLCLAYCIAGDDRNRHAGKPSHEHLHAGAQSGAWCQAMGDSCHGALSPPEQRAAGMPDWSQAHTAAR